MKAMNYSEIQDVLNEADMDGAPLYRIAILRNIVLEPIEPYLRYLAWRLGLNAKITYSEYDNIAQEAIGGGGGLLSDATDSVFVFMRLDTLSAGLTGCFAKLSADETGLEIDRIKQYVSSVLEGIRRQTSAMVLWHGFEMPVHPALGIWDSQTDDGQLATVRELNKYLRETLRSFLNCYFVDLNLCVSRIGSKQFYDPRYWHIGKAPYSREGLGEIAVEEFKFIRAANGKNKKCLVLDCDNTLWGGIVGEDGLAGIKIGKDNPGSPFHEFQLEILNLYHRGVILAICSKNNEDDVWEVFRMHPDMVLKEDQIAAAQINWADKPANLRQIAHDLNIGLDSLVFVDDSEFECHLVRQEIPEIEVIHLPKSRGVEYRQILASCGLFETLVITEEDKGRGATYKADAMRKQLRASATDLATYYKSLDMVLEVRFADDFSIPRIAQQTQKTNQFNLTTRRYTEADIKRYLDDPNVDVIYIKFQDKFGDSGIVGTAIIKRSKPEAIIDTLLLSCRILGRGVEGVFLRQILNLAKIKGCQSVQGEYYKTKKNAQTELFFLENGFSEIGRAPGDVSRSFQFSLDKPLPAGGGYFKAIHSEIDQVNQ